MRPLWNRFTALMARARRQVGRFFGPTATPIDPRDVKALLDQGHMVHFLDVRNDTAWGQADTKLPGARRVPLDDITAHVAGLPKDAFIVTYCT